MSIETRTVEYRDGEEVFEGLLAWDDKAQSPRPGVLVAHTIRGRSDFEHNKARDLAELGYVAFAIDVYGKDRIGGDLEDCRALMDALKADRPLLQRRLGVALTTLREQPEVDESRLAAIGFCFGGLCALDIARTGEDVAGVARAQRAVHNHPLAARVRRPRAQQVERHRQRVLEFQPAETIRLEFSMPLPP